MKEAIIVIFISLLAVILLITIHLKIEIYELKKYKELVN